MSLTQQESLFYEYILQSDLEMIKKYLMSSSLQLKDVLFSYHCLNQYQDDSSLQVAQYCWKEHRQTLFSLGNITLLKEFDDLTWSHLGLSTSFYYETSQEPSIQLFISQHFYAIEDKIQQLHKESKQHVYQPVLAQAKSAVAYQLQELLSTISSDKEQWVLPESQSLIPNHIRTNDLYHLDQKNLDDVCERLHSQLILNAYHYVIQGKKSLEEANAIIKKSLQVFHLFMEEGKQNNENLYYPLLNTLAHDLTSVFYHHPSFKTNSIELWDNVSSQSYPPKNIYLFTKGILPLELKEYYPQENMIYRAIWVMLEDHTILLAPDTLMNKNHSVYHIDIANGQPVLSAGVMVFSAQSGQLLAINNRSGHYNPSLDSVLTQASYFKKDNISSLIIGDYQWKNIQIVPLNEAQLNIKKMRQKTTLANLPKLK